MVKNTVATKVLKSSFNSCEKDAETIIKKLFEENKPYSDRLKRLLIINTPDCLNENNKDYQTIINNTSIRELMKEQYITLIPKLKINEHSEVKSYIILTFDNFTETYNPEYRDCIVSFDIICHTDYWGLQDYQLRPLKIAGVIDSILNKTKLSGIGTLQFVGCSQLILNEELSGYSLLYQAVHGNDDNLPNAG